MIRIPWSHLQDFINIWEQGGFPEQRFGQALYNHCQEQLKEPWTELFYHPNRHANKEVWDIFESRVTITHH